MKRETPKTPELHLETVASRRNGTRAITYRIQLTTIAVLAILFAACGNESPIDTPPDAQKDTQPSTTNPDGGTRHSHCRRIDPQLLEELGAIDLGPTDYRRIDPDTIKYKVGNEWRTGRFAGADGPECEPTDGCINGRTWPDQYGTGQYAEGQPLATNFCDAGNEFVDEALKHAQRIQVLEADKDNYGRWIIYLFVDGRLVPCEEVEAGFAYQNVTFYAETNGCDYFCERFARMIEEAGNDNPGHNFREPWLWKPENSVPCRE